jgi:hypothetical protein
MVATAAAGAAPMDRAAPSCRAEAPTVATSALRAKGGPRLGTVRLTNETIDGTSITCAVVDVRAKYRKRSTLVTRDLRERSADGDDLGQALSVARATKLQALSMSSSPVPSGSTFILRAKIDVTDMLKARGTVRFRVP